jgi:hypothetical protein
VQPAGCDQGEEIGGGVGVIVGADEQPRSSAGGNGSEGSLGGVILHMRRLIPS